MTNYSTVALSDYSILSCELDNVSFDSKCIINTVNQYSYAIAEQDDSFKAALTHSDILLPDGVGIVAAVRFLSNRFIKKISGSDIHSHLLNKLNNENGSCFYMGSSVKSLEKIVNKIHREYPNIKVGVFSPPFKEAFTKAENDLIINKVNKFKPDVLFVGMTAPKQEKWTYEFKNRLNVNTICTIGAVFDFYAGTILRPSKFWRNAGLEWLVRLVKEPARMFKRYVIYGPVFVMMLIKMKAEQWFFQGIAKA